MTQVSELLASAERCEAAMILATKHVFALSSERARESARREAADFAIIASTLRHLATKDERHA